jgi:hypothetical protein
MTLETELTYFESIKEELLRHNAGQFAVIKGDRLLGTYTTDREAFQAGVKEFRLEPFLLKHVVETEEVIQYPALAVGAVHARP